MSSDVEPTARARAANVAPPSRHEVLIIGLVGSFLTCVAATAANLMFERMSGGALPFIGRVAVGYASAASVVMLVFPQLVPRLAASVRRAEQADGPVR